MADPVLPWRIPGASLPRPEKLPGGALGPILAASGDYQRRQTVAAASRPDLPTRTPTGAALPWRAGVNRATAQARKKVEKGNTPGILGQVSQIIESIPTGLGRFAVDVGHDLFYSGPYELVRQPANALGADIDPIKFRLPSQFKESFARTATNIRHPSRYVDAYRRGEIVGTLLEDVANASIIGSVAAKPLSAVSSRAVARAAAERAAERALVADVIAGKAPTSALATASARAAAAEAAAQRLAVLGRVGEGLQSAARLGSRGADAPIKPIEWAGRAVARLGDVPVRGTPLRTMLSESGFGRGLAEVGQYMKQRSAANQLIEETVRRPKLQVRHDIAARGATAARGLSAEDLRLGRPAAEQLFEYEGTRKRLQALRDYGGDVFFEDFMERLNRGLEETDLAHAFTPEQVMDAFRYAEGSLPPERMAAVQRQVALLANLSREFQEQIAIPGVGMERPLDPEQLGTGRLTAALDTPGVQRAEQLLEARKEQYARELRRLAEMEARGLPDVEPRLERAGQRLVVASERQAALEGRRRRLADQAERHRARAEEIFVRADQRAAQAAARAQRRAEAVEQRGDARAARLAKEAEGRFAAAREYQASADRMRAELDNAMRVATEMDAEARRLRQAIDSDLALTEPVLRDLRAQAADAERAARSAFAEAERLEAEAVKLEQRAQVELSKVPDIQGLGNVRDEATTAAASLRAGAEERAGQIITSGLQRASAAEQRAAAARAYAEEAAARPNVLEREATLQMWRRDPRTPYQLGTGAPDPRVQRIIVASEQQAAREGNIARARQRAEREQAAALQAQLRADQQAAQVIDRAERRAAAVERRAEEKIVRAIKEAGERGQRAREATLGAAERRTSAEEALRRAVTEEDWARARRGDIEALRAERDPRLAEMRARAQEAERTSAAALRQAERIEETLPRLAERAQVELSKVPDITEVGRILDDAVREAEAIRLAGEVKANAIAERADDAAKLAETRAERTEAKLAELADKNPMGDATTREFQRVMRAGEQVGTAKERLHQQRLRTEKTKRAVERATERLERERQKAWDSLDAAPARFRPALAVAREADRALEELITTLRVQGADSAVLALSKLRAEYPASLDALVDAGIDPTYLPAGYDPEARRRVRTGLVGNRNALRRSRLSAEQKRQTQIRPQTFEGTLSRLDEEWGKALGNHAAKKFGEEHGVTARDLGMDEKTKPADIVARMAEEGREAWDPTAPDSTPTNVGLDTLFVPKYMKRTVANAFTPPSVVEQALRAVADPARRGWKDLTLPLSGAWHIGNAVSNALMMTVATGSLAPLSRVPEAVRLVRAEGRGVSGIPARIFSTTAEHELNNFLRRKTGKDPNVVRRGLDKLYAINQFVDDVARVAVYLSEYDRLVARGLDAAAARDAAITSSLRIAGDFTNLSKFEQQYVRRIIPFYTWLRHITQLTAHLAVHDPIRLVWTMHLADLYADPDNGPFGDAFIVGGGFVSVGNLSPFGTVANVFGNERGPLAGLLAQVGPEIKIAAAAFGGMNLDRGGAPLRLPPGFGNLDAFGNESNTPLLGKPGEILGVNVPVVGALANYTIGEVPLARTALDLLAGERVVTYDTGEPRLFDGKLRDSTPRIAGTDIGGRFGILARQAGIPTRTPFDVEGSIETAQAKIRSAAKARERYRKQLEKARR